MSRIRRVSVLHGMLGHPEALAPFCSSVSRALGLSVRAMLLPGHGESPWGTELRTFDEVVDALAERMFPAGAEDELVVGYSLGGRLALGLLDRVRPGAVVAVGAHLGIVDPAERVDRRRWDLEKAAEVRALGLEDFARQWEQQPLFASQRALPEVRLTAQRSHRTRHVADAIAWAFDVLGTGSMPELLPRIRGAAVLLVAGALDAKFVAHYEAQRVVATRIVPGAGHNVVLERPEALVELLHAEFARVSASREVSP